MRALRSVANADDEGIANEDGGFAIADLAVSEMGWARHHEQLVAIYVQLWQLVCEERVLDRQRVQVVILLKLAQFRLGRLEQSDPDEFGAIGCTADRLIERDRADPLAISIETGGDDAHRGGLSKAPRDSAAAQDQGGGNVGICRQHDVLLPCGSLSPHFADAPRRASSRSQAGSRVRSRHHALRPERIQQQRRAEATGGGHCSGTPALRRPSRTDSVWARYVGSSLIAVQAARAREMAKAGSSARPALTAERASAVRPSCARAAANEKYACGKFRLASIARRNQATACS